MSDGRDIEAVGVETPRREHFLCRDPASAEMAIICGAVRLNNRERWAVNRPQEISAPREFVVDDLESVDPWTPRGIEIRGRAELHDQGGEQRFGADGWDSAWFTVVPQRIISWGIEGPPFSEAGRSARSVIAP